MPIVKSSTILCELLEYTQPQLLRILKQNCASIILYNIKKTIKLYHTIWASWYLPKHQMCGEQGSAPFQTVGTTYLVCKYF